MSAITDAASTPRATAAPLPPASGVPVPPAVEVPLTPTGGGEARSDAPAKPAKMRDGSLDVMRAVALSRVVVWHAFGTAVISWIVATMPIMFFVAGSLLARSLDRMQLRVLYRKRMKRLLVPYWFFGGVVLIVAQLAYLSDPSDSRWVAPGKLLAWIFPFTDPTVSGWEGGWASSPMWYLRAYLWLLIASPVLRWAQKRFGALALLPAIALAAAVELWIHHPTVLIESTGMVPGQLAWMVGEFGLYAFFLMLGFLHHDGYLEHVTRWVAAEWVLIGIAATAIWWKYFPAPTGVVNHTFIGLLASGVGWVSLFLMVKPLMNRVANNDIGGAVVGWFTGRAMTIYLWHSPSIVIGYWLLDRFAPEVSRVWVLAPTAILVVVAVALFGWVEDVSAGQPARFWPRPKNSIMWNSFGFPGPSRTGHRGPVFAGLSIGVVAMTMVASTLVQRSLDSDGGGVDTATAASAGGDLALPPAPSGKPAIADFGDDTASADGGDLALPPAPSGKPAIGDFADAGADEALSDSGGDLALPPAPSGKPAIGDFGDDGSSDDTSAAAGGADVETVIADWLAAKEVDGARVAIATPDGEITTAAVGDVAIDDIVKITSITKTMTSSIILGDGRRGAPRSRRPAARDPSGSRLPIPRSVHDPSAADAHLRSHALSNGDGLRPDQAAHTRAGGPDVGRDRARLGSRHRPRVQQLRLPPPGPDRRTDGREQL